MKTVYIFLLVAILVAISTDAQTEGKIDCPTFCTFDYNPVCGYNGTCYRKFGNRCTLKAEQCSNAKKNASDIKAVDMDLCEKALAKSNPDVIACSEDEQ